MGTEEAAGGRCGHRGHLVVVGRVGSGRSGPERPSSAAALAALRDEARRSFEETG